MAIFRTGPLAGAISGTVGGAVFVAGRGTPVIRQRPIGTKRTSPALQVVRARFSNFQRAWSDLSSSTQDAWRTLARNTNVVNRLGQAAPASGYTLFVRYNVELQGNTALEFSDPPTLGKGPIPRSVSAVFSAAGTYVINAQPPTGFGTANFYLYGNAFARDHERRGPARLVFLQFLGQASITQNVRTLWEARWGALQEDQRFVIGVASRTANTTLSQIVMARGATSA